MFSLNMRGAIGEAAEINAPAASAAVVRTADTAVGKAAALNDAGEALIANSWNASALGSISPQVFSLALEAANAAIERGDVRQPKTLTIVDFSKPSTEERLWVYDVRTHELLYQELVAHGRGSGRTYATQFSNQPESNRSSLGLFVTAEAYVGKNGYSLRLDGLEPGINDRARERAVGIHGAPYVNAASAKAQGYLGRSLGCPALRPEITRKLIDTIKGGSLVFAYYPEQSWLRASSYLAQSAVAN